MTINASSYFRPCDCEGGLIETDTTIYLAPSASSDSPTGVIGSDVTGDGTELRPFYSIKRAIEYLENYRIKIGAYVTIEGTPGIYHYNYNDHSVEVKHKDAKYIKIKFDHMEPGYYHETTITGDTVSKDSTTISGVDLITFTVNDIGTGFYQIQAGDYIKILANNDLWDDPSYAVWNGYYKVYSVDTTNKTVTIIDQKEQPLNTDHDYRDKLTLPTSDDVYVYKLSSHVNIDFPSFDIDDEFFIRSEYGFGGIQINASSTEFYMGNFVYIYDGIINDCVFVLSNFYKTVYFENLQSNFDNSVSNCVFTSCYKPIYLLQSTSDISGFSINNCNDGVSAKSSVLSNQDILLKMVIINNYYHGVDIRQTQIHISSDPTSVNVLNVFNCSDGLVCYRGSSITGTGQNYRYNHNGINITENSILRCYGTQENGTIFSSFMYNTNGVLIDTGSFADLSYVNSSYNDGYGINISNNSIAISHADETWNVTIKGNSSTGLTVDGGKIYITRLYSYNNNYGVYVTRNSDVSLYDMYIQNNEYGIVLNRGSRAILYSSDSSYDVNNNNTKNISCYLSGWINAYMKTTLTDTSPAVNTSPSYSAGTGSDSYIISTTY